MIYDMDEGLCSGVVIVLFLLLYTVATAKNINSLE